ncbi:MAG: hypothetical protein AB1689_10620 [Thermodesulfobacteriota bacterium]
MTGALAVLAVLRARGVRVYRRGNKLRLEPLEALTPELVAAARAVRDELLAIVSGADCGPYGYGRCFACGAELPDGVAIAYCRPCWERLQ